jgi:hypothetical protein
MGRNDGTNRGTRKIGEDEKKRKTLTTGVAVFHTPCFSFIP